MNPAVNPRLQLSTAELLDSIPVPSRTVRCEREREGELVLSIPLAMRWYMRPPISWILPFSRRRRIALDALGIEVWRACNGSRSTEAIIEAFSQRHHLTFHESRLSVLQFLKELTRRGMIAMVGAPGAGGSRP